MQPGGLICNLKVKAKGRTELQQRTVSAVMARCDRKCDLWQLMEGGQVSQILVLIQWPARCTPPPSPAHKMSL